MKIKDVCDITGLSDRTIRYYIEQGLINPSFTKNYLGRKKYDFSQADIDNLKDIATLRKYDFSIADINAIKQNPNESVRIIREVKTQKQKNIDNENEILNTLNKLYLYTPYQLHELAAALEESSHNTELPKEDMREKIKSYILSVPKILLSIFAGVPPLIFLFFSLTRFQYPVFTLWSIVAIFLTVLPIILVVKNLFSDENHYGLLVFCILYIPISAIFSITPFNSSRTTNINNYCIFEPDSLLNQVGFTRELFPAYANTFDMVKDENGEYIEKKVDAKYYYSYKQCLDYTYDVYAQWPLEKNDFYGEVSRVKNLYKEYNQKYFNDFDSTNYATVKRGNYMCLIKYNFDDDDKLFEKVTDNYELDMFAYDEEHLTVRYIHCSSLQNGAEQPYYLQLEW